MSAVDVYRVGICYASVCVPADMPLEDVARAVNQSFPTGLDSRGWQPSDDETFATGAPNPCPCEHDPSRLHRLFEC